MNATLNVVLEQEKLRQHLYCFFSHCSLQSVAELSTKILMLLPRVLKIKIRNLTLNRLLNVEFVKKMFLHPGAHYSERQGLMGYMLNWNSITELGTFGIFEFVQY